MKALLPALLLFVNGDMPPERADVELGIACGTRSCIVPIDLMRNMVEAHNAHVNEIRGLEKQLADMKVIKGCAKLEVLPKLKRERDT